MGGSAARVAGGLVSTPKTGGSLRTHWATIGIVLVIGWANAEAAFATEVDDAIAAAMSDVEQGRCEQAFGRLAAIDGLENRARLVAGQCQIRAGLYLEALAVLEPARAGRDLNSGQLGDVELYRAVALYHLERFAEASAALDQADGRTGDR